MKKILTDINIDGKVTANGSSEFSLTNSDDSSITIQQLYNRIVEMIYLYDTNAYKVAIDYEGYYYNSDFYEDSSYQTAMTGVNDKYYRDLTSDYIYQYQTSEYVDVTTDVVVTPNDTKLYIDLLTDKAYRWDGTEFISISDGGSGGGEQIQYDTLPTPSATYLGKILQYIGVTGNDYINGYFYECVSDGESTPTYSWEQKDVMPVTTDLGGRNLVIGSDTMDNWRSSSYSTLSSQSLEVNDRPDIRFTKCKRCDNIANNGGMASDNYYVNFKQGDKLTESFWIRVNTDMEVDLIVQPYWHSTSSKAITYINGIQLTTEWQYIKATSEVTEDYTGIASLGYVYAYNSNALSEDYFEVCGLKVEKGDIATDWTPSIEEMTKESFLQWGGKNFAGSYGPLDAALVSELGANRMAFAKAAGITIEYSRDGGSTWTDFGATNAQKLGLTSVIGNSAFGIGKNDSTNKATANGTLYQLRITIDTYNANVYTELTKFVIYVSTNGSSYSTVTIQKATNGSPNSYVTQVSDVPLSGWSGYNVINLDPTIVTYGNRAEQYQKLRFIFKADGGNTSYNGLNVYNIFGYGGVGWTAPSNMAKSGHLYSYDSDQNVTFPANIKFNGGTSGIPITAVWTGNMSSYNSATKTAGTLYLISD